VLSELRLHAETGEPMPQALIEKAASAARTFNQGCATVEYTSSALVDLAFHALDRPREIDPLAFEKAELAASACPRAW
jgi:peptidyl-dipeptidase Dcp